MIYRKKLEQFLTVSFQLEVIAHILLLGQVFSWNIHHSPVCDSILKIEIFGCHGFWSFLKQ